MPIFRWGQQWDDAFRDLESEVDRLLQGVNLTFQGLRLTRRYPLLNLYELPDQFILTAELPGAKADDLEITVASGILTLKGRRDDSTNVSAEAFRRNERFRGEWQRSISLPERVEEDGMRADFNHGVLKITLPRAPLETPRQIPIVEESE